MVPPNSGATKIIYNLKLAAAEMQELISDPHNYEDLRNLIDHVKDNYEGPISSWLTGWVYWFTRRRVSEIESVSQVLSRPDYNLEKLLCGILNIFSKGEWKSTSLNTVLMDALLKMLAQKKQYDADEQFDTKDKLHLRYLLVKALETKIEQIRDEQRLASICAEIEAEKRRAADLILIQEILASAKKIVEEEKERKREEQVRQNRMDDLNQALGDKADRDFRYSTVASVLTQFMKRTAKVGFPLNKTELAEVALKRRETIAPALNRLAQQEDLKRMHSVVDKGKERKVLQRFFKRPEQQASGAAAKHVVDPEVTERFRQYAVPAKRHLAENKYLGVKSLFVSKADMPEVSSLMEHAELKDRLEAVRHRFHAQVSSSRAGFFKRGALQAKNMKTDLGVFYGVGFGQAPLAEVSAANMLTPRP